MRFFTGVGNGRMCAHWNKVPLARDLELEFFLSSYGSTLGSLKYDCQWQIRLLLLLRIVQWMAEGRPEGRPLRNSAFFTSKAPSEISYIFPGRSAPPLDCIVCRLPAFNPGSQSRDPFSTATLSGTSRRMLAGYRRCHTYPRQCRSYSHQKQRSSRRESQASVPGKEEHERSNEWRIEPTRNRSNIQRYHRVH